MKRGVWLLILVVMLFSPDIVLADLVGESVVPFWIGNKIVNESTMLVSYNGGLAESNLLFPSTNIILVRNSALDIIYTPGTDWIVSNNKLILPVGSRIPFLNESEIRPPKVEENTYFHTKQIAVTYRHSGQWLGPIPRLDRSYLPETLAKLEAGTPMKVLLYGDSISVGANASGYFNVPPNLPIWGRLVTTTLERVYRNNITFLNSSVGGKDSAWGRDNVNILVNPQYPDLVIVAFGMNDGTNRIGVESFVNNIRYIINQINTAHPKTEIIVVTTTLANSESIYSGTQQTYRNEMLSLARPGVAVVDMTGVHEELLKTKKFADITGNNVNHPNDYLSRWYAQQVIGLLVSEVKLLEGKVVKGSSSTLYKIENGKRRNILDMETYYYYGFKDDDWMVVDDNLLISIPEGGQISWMQGDFDDNSRVDLMDYVKWRTEYMMGKKPLMDFVAWRRGYLR